VRKNTLEPLLAFIASNEIPTGIHFRTHDLPLQLPIGGLRG
jgi:hypothetical protein